MSPEMTESSSRAEVQNADTEPLKLAAPTESSSVAWRRCQDDQMCAQRGCEGVSKALAHCCTPQALQGIRRRPGGLPGWPP